MKKVGQITVGKGKLETAVAGGTGLVFVNEENTHSIALLAIAHCDFSNDLALPNINGPRVVPALPQ